MGPRNPINKGPEGLLWVLVALNPKPETLNPINKGNEGLLWVLDIWYFLHRLVRGIGKSAPHALLERKLPI